MDKKRIIEFCNTAMKYQIREDDTGFYSFNKDTEFKKYWKDIKQMLFDDGFEIKDSYYRFLSNAFDDISDYLKNNDDINTIEPYEYCEGDVYLNDLLKWLLEDIRNVDYCDEVLEEYNIKSMFEILQIAQSKAKEEVFMMAMNIIKYLEKIEEEE